MKKIVKITKYVKCFDKFDVELKEFDTVDVQKIGKLKIYKKTDGQLYFTPYGEEDRVSAYFKNDLIKVDEKSLPIHRDEKTGLLYIDDVPFTKDHLKKLRKLFKYSKRLSNGCRKTGRQKNLHSNLNRHRSTNRGS